MAKILEFEHHCEYRMAIEKMIDTLDFTLTQPGIELSTPPPTAKDYIESLRHHCEEMLLAAQTLRDMRS